MTDKTDDPFDLGSLNDVSNGLAIASTVLSLAYKAGSPARYADKHAAHIKSANGVIKTGTSILAGGSAVAAASCLTVAATSGAGIATGLAAAGSVVGGGMAAGPVAIAAGPTYLGVQAVNRIFFAEADHHNAEETAARKRARLGANVGGAAAVIAAGASVVAGGASGSAIMGTLASVGSLIGGGALAGTFVIAAAPIAVAWAGGYGVYRLFGGGKRSANFPQVTSGD